jgi:hypothetical protein
MCVLCNNSEENISHISIFCPFTLQVWRDICHCLGLHDIWAGNCLEECLLVWFQRQDLKGKWATSFLVLCGICLAQNALLFDNRQVPPFQVSAQVSGCRNFPTPQKGFTNQDTSLGCRNYM